MLAVLVASVAALRVGDLRCEYLSEPRGLDTPHPRFTWSLQDSDTTARAVRQASYRLTVGEVGGTTLWDSGSVTTASSFNVRYAGPALASGTTYWWTIDVDASALADLRNLTTSASGSSTFSMGLLTAADWAGAQFVGMAEGSGTECPWFRRSFHLSPDAIASLGAAGASAMLYVASVGYADVSVNGKRASEAVLAPSISFLPKRVLYRTYDVSALLVAGENALGVWACAAWGDCAPTAQLHAPDRLDDRVC
jgi:alpha-L-rhamnosidase